MHFQCRIYNLLIKQKINKTLNILKHSLIPNKAVSIFNLCYIKIVKVF